MEDRKLDPFGKLQGKVKELKVPPIDKTLTKEGYTADAKAVGDEIKKVNTNAETLDSAVKEMESEISSVKGNVTKLDSDLAVERKRINNLTANTGEQTEGNAELLDIRVGYDGTVYNGGAGVAVRAQVSDLHTKIDNNVSQLSGEIDEYINLLFDKKNVDYLEFAANNNYLTGWMPAYVKEVPGEKYGGSNSSSNYMMCRAGLTVENVLVEDSLLELTPPNGYCCRITVMDKETNIIIEKIGVINNATNPEETNVTRLVRVNPAYKYALEVGRFDGNVSDFYNDTDFINSIKCIVYTQKAKNVEDIKKPIRILGIGNSWTRDALRWLWKIAEDAGISLIVGHAYLGGSNLRDQYFGLHNTSYTYSHGGINQVVHNTYQYWKYTDSSTPTKTPSTNYDNGLNGIGVTLESVVSDEPWDYIVFMQSRGDGGVFEGWYDETKTCITDDGKTIHWDIAKFLDDIVDMLPEGTPTPKIGMAIPWAHPTGDTSSLTEGMLVNYNDGINPDGADVDENHTRDAMFERMHTMMQETALDVANYLGDKCEFVVNTGLALYKARQNKYLCQLGYKLQRAKNNTHLAEGLPMYIAGLTYAYEILGIDRRNLNWFPAGTVDAELDGDEGDTITTTVSNTKSLADMGRKCSWLAQMCE